MTRSPEVENDRRGCLCWRRHIRVGERISQALEKHSWLRSCLLNFVLLGTCALIGDGILTPAISGRVEQLTVSCLAQCPLCHCRERLLRELQRRCGGSHYLDVLL